MQTQTMAIGQKGIEFFCQQYLAVKLQDLIRTMTVPNRVIDVGNFRGSGSGMGTDYTHVKVELTSGRLENFHPLYQSVSQLPSGNPSGSEFVLDFVASNFSVAYQWRETGRSKECMQMVSGQVSCQTRDFNHPYDYWPGFGRLEIRVTTAFEYRSTTTATGVHMSYDVVARNSTGSASDCSANIPSRSVIRNEIDGCWTNEVLDTTRSAVADINFGALINQIMPPTLHSIEDSGKLGNDIRFIFGLGNDGMKFSTAAGSNGLQIGITGYISHRGEYYPEPVTPPLGLPPIPQANDPNYLHTYISAWSINGLQWACYKAGLLHAQASRSNVPYPEQMACAGYIEFVPELADYADKYLVAEIRVEGPPTTEFQLFRIPDPNVPDSFITTPGMVMQQNLRFMVLVDTGEPSPPYFVYSAQRTDYLTHLRLGVAPGTTVQTLQFDCLKMRSSYTFIDSSFASVNARTFARPASDLFNLVETDYEKNLASMGKRGVPIPMMQMFRFVYQDAQISVQDGFVAIHARVQL